MVSPLAVALPLAFINLVLAKEQPQTFFSVAFPKVCVSSSDITFSVTLPPLDGSLPWDSALLKIEDTDTHETYVNMTIDVYATAGKNNVDLTYEFIRPSMKRKHMRIMNDT